MDELPSGESVPTSAYPDPSTTTPSASITDSSKTSSPVVDRPESQLKAELNKLQISPPDTKDIGNTITGVDIGADTSKSNVPEQADDSDDDLGSEEWSSGESYDNAHYMHHMSKRDIRLYEEKRALEKQEPIQAHLENLHQAFWGVDPEYTVFAFGGTISKEQVDIGEMVLRVGESALAREGATPDAEGASGEGGKNADLQDLKSPDEDRKGKNVAEHRITEFKFPLMGDEAIALLKLSNIAPFGKGSETVVDHSYRDAYEITPDRFELKPDPILSSENILDDIAKTFHLSCKVRAEIAKVNLYATGGFFGPHCDTPRSSEHIGTIVMALPGAHQGGVLSVQHGGPKVNFNWGTPYGQDVLVPMTEIPWAFLYGDCEHEVGSVHQGIRLTVTYDVFTIPSAKRDTSADRFSSDAICRALREAIDDHDGFAKQGCILAFGLSHSYPQTSEPLWKGLEARLKGQDAILWRAITRCGSTYSFKAAFNRPKDYNTGYGDGQEWGKAQNDGLSDTTLNAVYRNGLKRFQVILTDKPDAIEGRTDYGESFGDSRFFETLDQDQPEINQLVWVDLPQSYGFKNNYGFIGNGPCDPAEAYSGVVMLVNIPPADQR